MNICKLTVPEETCCFTGHRKILQSDEETLPMRLDATVRELYERGVRHFRCGGALGFDTLSAITVLRLRTEAPDARLVLVLPCRGQAAGWSAGDRQLYERILARADEVVYASVEYSRESMMIRNRALVDGSGVCVAYMNSVTGGTAYTVRYAKRSFAEVINLGSLDI